MHIFRMLTVKTVLIPFTQYFFTNFKQGKNLNRNLNRKFGKYLKMHLGILLLYFRGILSKVAMFLMKILDTIALKQILKILYIYF